MINQALGDYNRIIPRARGEAEQTVQQAEGYAMDRVNRAKGDASLYKDLLKAYKKAPGNQFTEDEKNFLLVYQVTGVKTIAARIIGKEQYWINTRTKKKFKKL